MAKDHIGYEALADRALRSVVKEALKHTEKHGLLGPHHFYLTFRTRDPGVELPAFLLERHPEEEMTIVLQNQFWGLKVTDESFEVSLTFQKMPATLVVPFSALTAFWDPSVQFGLRFGGESPAKKVPGAPQGPKLAGAAGAATAPVKLPSSEASKPGSKTEDAKKAEAPQVVSIDKFRKK